MPPSGDDPNGENPDGDDMIGGDSPEELSETQKAILRAIAAVDDKESLTEDAIQKFCFMLGNKYGVDPFKLYSIYLRGPYSKDVKKNLCELDEMRIIESQPSQSPKVNTVAYSLTEKGENLLDEIGEDSQYREKYDLFKRQYGASGSWEEYNKIAYRWLSSESQYVAVDSPLFDGLRKKVAFSDDFDSFFENILKTPRPGFINDFETEKAPIAKLAYYLVKRKKCPGNTKEQHIDNSIRFSTRNILKYWDSNPTDSKNKTVLLRGYAESIQHKDRIFYLKEDRLETSPTIRIEFYGEWDIPSEKILEKHSIGVLGYVTESNEEVTIKALAIIKANELPEDLQSRKLASSTNNPEGETDIATGQTTLSEGWDQQQTDTSPTRRVGQVSLSQFSEKQQTTLERIEEYEEAFAEGSDEDISKESEEKDWIDAWEEVFEDLADVELTDRERMKERLQKVADKFEGATGKMMKMDFLIELLRWIWNNGPI